MQYRISVLPGCCALVLDSWDTFSMQKHAAKASLITAERNVLCYFMWSSLVTVCSPLPKRNCTVLKCLTFQRTELKTNTLGFALNIGRSQDFFLYPDIGHLGPRGLKSLTRRFTT